MKRRPSGAFLLTFVAVAAACSSDQAAPTSTSTPSASAALSAHSPDASVSSTGVSSQPSTLVDATPEKVTITVVGTNDLHGRVTALPLLGGYLDNLRARRAQEQGGVVLVDAGDMFQGTLESNLAEGKPVRDAYALLGYAAVAIGNHEFDYGPVGPPIVPSGPGDDPRGALKALTKDATFPFLAANIQSKDGSKLDWENVVPAAMIFNAGVQVGIIGVTTTDTLTTTIAPNVRDLTVEPLTTAVTNEAKRLRDSGVSVVVVVAHAGGKCKSFGHDIAADHCEDKSEIFELARALPKGSVDTIVAGHTHAGVAHEVNGIPIIESFAYGRAFGRVDLVVDKKAKRVLSHVIHAPQDLCPNQERPDFSTCTPAEYEGVQVVRRQDVAAVLAPALDSAKDKRAAKVGPTLPEGLRKSYDDESPLGNWFADALLRAVPNADVALVNGGGLRADLPKGELTYGALFEAFPFDNRIATAEISPTDLATLLASNLRGGHGILSIAGARVVARCKGSELKVSVVSAKTNKPFAEDKKLLLVGSDFLFLGGDSFWGDLEPPNHTILEELLRDGMERSLAPVKTVSPADVFNPKKPRLDLEPKRPMRCR